jgi:hypothetical protein
MFTIQILPPPLDCVQPSAYTVIMSGFYGGNGGMLPFRSKMFADGGPARVMSGVRSHKS